MNPFSTASSNQSRETITIAGPAIEIVSDDNSNILVRVPYGTLGTDSGKVLFLAPKDNVQYVVRTI